MTFSNLEEIFNYCKYCKLCQKFVKIKLQLQLNIFYSIPENSFQVKNNSIIIIPNSILNNNHEIIKNADNLSGLNYFYFYGNCDCSSFRESKAVSKNQKDLFIFQEMYVIKNYIIYSDNIKTKICCESKDALVISNDIYYKFNSIDEFLAKILKLKTYF